MEALLVRDILSSHALATECFGPCVGDARMFLIGFLRMVHTCAGLLRLRYGIYDTLNLLLFASVRRRLVVDYTSRGV